MFVHGWSFLTILHLIQIQNNNLNREESYADTKLTKLSMKDGP